MYGDNLVTLKKNIVSQLIADGENIITLDDASYIPPCTLYGSLAIGDVLRNCANLLNDINSDYRKSVKLLYHKYIQR